MGRTALHLAASEGYWRCVRFILQNGGDVNAKDRFGRIALQDAIDGKHKGCTDEIEGYLLVHGSDYKTGASMFGKIKTSRDLEMEKASRRKDPKSKNDGQDYQAVYGSIPSTTSAVTTEAGAAPEAAAAAVAAPAT